jgi:hypothetical protein
MLATPQLLLAYQNLRSDLDCASISTNGCLRSRCKWAHRERRLAEIEREMTRVIDKIKKGRLTKG